MSELTPEILQQAFKAIRDAKDDRVPVVRDLGGARHITRAGPIFVSPAMARDPRFQLAARWYYGEISLDEFRREFANLSADEETL